jgi:hypothetical protein
MTCAGGGMSGDVCKDHAEFGVLFVGGIGSQSPGSTVRAFAVALHRWLFWWNRATNLSEPPSPVLHDAVLSPALGGDEDPAHVTLDVPQFKTDTYQGRWLLAESSWAEESAVPRFVDLAHWFWKVSTCLLVLQFVIPIHRHWNQTKKDSEERAPLPLRLGVVVGYLILMGLAAIFSVLLSLVLFAVAVAALLPIPRIDLAVRWLVVKLSAVLGDTYVLAHCPVEFAAMRSRVARDLGWLRARCDKVAVVGHSQGAAIAHQVLQDGYWPGKVLPEGGSRPGSLRAFITLGQGISKLHLLQAMDWNPGVRKAALLSRWLVAVGLATAGLPALGWVVSRLFNVTIFSAQPAIVAIPMIVAGFMLILLGVHHAMSVVQKVCYDKLYLCIKEPDFLWTDYYASADPVSNGPFPETRNPSPDRLPFCCGPSACAEVYNASSLLTDHNSYLRNQDQLLPGLLNALVTAAYSDGPGKAADGPLVAKEDIDKACERRHRLARWLVASRVLIAAVAVVAWFFSPVRILQGPMNQLAHLADPHAQMSHSLVHVVAAALIAAAAYLVVAIIPWKIKEYFNMQNFFRTAARCGTELVAGEPASDATKDELSSSLPETVSAVMIPSKNHSTS